MAFPKVDGSAEVYVNGQKLEPIGHGRKTADGPVQKRTFFELDLSAAVKAGDSHVAVRVDNRKITELFLGGILRPVVLTPALHTATLESGKTRKRESEKRLILWRTHDHTTGVLQIRRSASDLSLFRFFAFSLFRRCVMQRRS